MRQDALVDDFGFPVAEGNGATTFGQGFFHRAIGFVLVGQAAEQASTLTGNLVGIQGQALLFGHFDRNRSEIGQKCTAAEFPTTDAEAAGEFGFVPYADLAHFDAGVKVVRQVLDQVPEIDPAVGGEIEHDLGTVEQIFGPHQLHIHFAFLDPLLAELEGLPLPSAVGGRQGSIFFGGQAQHTLQILRGFVGFDLSGGGDHDGHGPATVGFHHHLIAGLQGVFLGVEVVMLAGDAKFKRHNA